MKTLYGKSKTGKVLVWSIWVEGDSFIVKHGQLDGKMQTKRTKATAKNIGKSNETTPEQQAIVEMEAKYALQKKKGYYETKVEALNHVEFSPMKLANYDDHSTKITFPCGVQNKLDGMRYMVRKDGSGLSKQGEIISMPKHIQDDINLLIAELGTSFKGLDGEIYTGNQHRGGLSLQKIISAFRKENKDTASLQYWIYNIPDSTKTFSQRLEMLKYIQTIINSLGLRNLKVVDTTICSGIYEVDLLFNRAIEDKEEGIVIHNLKAEYEFGSRSYNSQKRKPRQDAEARVVGVTVDKNGQGVLDCVAVNGKQEGAEFKCLMRKDADLHINYRLYENAVQLVGKHISYQYENLTDSIPPKPAKPVGIALREVDQAGNPLF